VEGYGEALSNPLQTAYAPRGDAEQRIYTPVPIIELCLAVWPEGIGCDPFPGDLAPVTSLAAARLLDGFAEPWPDRSYANPPFNRLKEAMAVAALAGHGGRVARPSFDEPQETILLGPAQTHRTWFWPHSGMVVAWLKPLKFVGFTSTYPKPLCLHYWGSRRERFVEAVNESRTAVHVSHSTPLEAA
jgi:hypothetical protein